MFQRWRLDGERTARDELVRRHLPLAHKLALRYRRTREPLDDLFQVSSLALVKAIDRFDPDRGIGFSSFAVPTILGELKRHFRDKGWSIHLPRGLMDLVLRVQAAEVALGSRSGRSPTVVEIAEYLAVETEQVLEALEAAAALYAASLDAPIASDTDGAPLSPYEMIGADDEHYALIDTSASLAAAITQLSPADREVLALRFRQKLTQREIAARIGVSQMQVSRILRRITAELRTRLDPQL